MKCISALNMACSLYSLLYISNAAEVIYMLKRLFWSHGFYYIFIAFTVFNISFNALHAVNLDINSLRLLYSLT